MNAVKFHVMDNVVWLTNEYTEWLMRNEAAREEFERKLAKNFRERAERAVDSAWERNREGVRTSE